MSSVTSKTLAQAVAAAWAEMPAIEKNATNPHFRSKFTSLDHLISKTRPVLKKHDLAIVQLPSHTDSGHPTLTTMILHGASGDSIRSDTLLLVGKDDMQGLGAAITYARRYAWASACGIADEDDDDGNSISTTTTSAPRSGASGSSGGTNTAVEPQRQDSPPAAAVPAVTNGEFRFASGKYADKTLGEVPSSYLDWYLANGPRDDVKAAINAHLGLEPAGVDADIPF